MKPEFDIIVAGHLCADFIPNLEGVSSSGLLIPGTLTEIGPLSISTGGAVSNTGLSLDRLGEKVGLISLIGDDAVGSLTLELLRGSSSRIASGIVRKKETKSSYSVVLAPHNSDRSFLHYPGTNSSFSSEHIDWDLVKKAKIFHLGYPPLMPRLIEKSGEALREIFFRIKNMEVVTSMDMVVPDPNGPSGQVDWSEILQKVLPFTDIFLPSLDEIVFMLRRKDWERWKGKLSANIDRDYLYQLAGEILDRGAVVAGIKLGEKGMYLRTSGSQKLQRLANLGIQPKEWTEQEYWHPAFSVDVKGTTGAGDSAYAGFLAALLKKLPPHAAVKVACAVGACNVEHFDSLSGVLSWGKTLERIEKGWKTRPDNLPGYTNESF